MNSKTDELRKELVKRAKQRMIHHDYEAAAADDSKLTVEITDEKLKKYAKIVKEVKESEVFVYDPLIRMADVEYMKGLTENERVGYLLELSKIYKELSEKYEKA